LLFTLVFILFLPTSKLHDILVVMGMKKMPYMCEESELEAGKEKENRGGRKVKTRKVV
jgi:hypothetical protein